MDRVCTRREDTSEPVPAKMQGQPSKAMDHVERGGLRRHIALPFEIPVDLGQHAIKLTLRCNGPHQRGPAASGHRDELGRECARK